MKSLRQSLLVAGFFLLIFGAKLWLIDVAGSDLPTWDQWDGEGEATLRPWLEGKLTLHNITVPHNEHRLITTRLYLLGLFALNGQWDSFFETTANAAIHPLFAVALLLLARRWLQGPWLAAFGATLILLFTLPFADDNTLVGFQVQFYFLLLFSLGHIALTLESDRFTWRWGLGQLCGGLALVTMASGFFSSAAILVVLGHRFASQRRWTAQNVSSAIVATLIVLSGLMLKAPMPAHDGLKAQGVGSFFHGLLQLLAWPGSALFPWAIALSAPAFVFALRRVRPRSLPAPEAILAGLLAWVMLQCAATAYARNLDVLTPRYLDLVAVNVALGFVFLAREFSGRTRQLLATLWLAGVLLGLAHETRQRWTTATEPNISRQRRREANVRAYVQTEDPAALLNQPPDDIPYPSARTLIHLLRPPISNVLPPSVRQPVPVDENVSAPSAVLPSEVPLPAFAHVVSTWTSSPKAGDLKWHSAIQSSASLPVLRFRVAGDLGTAGRDLHLVVKSAAGEVPVEPDESPGLRWKTVNVFRPPGAWWIEAADHDPEGWFAFTAPVEVGRWTWLAEKLLKHHLTIMTAGGLLILSGGLVHLTWPRTPLPDSP